MSLFGKSKVETTDIEKRFNLIGRVGQGSMSKVWRAEDKMSGNFVAVKVLDKEKTKRFEERFKGLNKPTEADIAFSLKHPYIVKTLEVGWTLEKEMFLVMDYVEGSGLSLLVDLQSDEMRRYRTRYMIQIGDALAYFHKQNWIHRDICPRNIMITDDHKVRLIDFGLTVPSTPEFCKPGNRTGTANYMAPELIKRRPTDQRIDVFAYAVTCYEMYAKRHPWEAAQTLDAVMQHINQPPVPLSELVPKIDSKMAEIIMKGLEMDPNDRWQTIEEMVEAFREVEVRLVKATKELLNKRRLRDGGGPLPDDEPSSEVGDAVSGKGKAKKKKRSRKSAGDVPPASGSAEEKPFDPENPFGDDTLVSDDAGGDLPPPASAPKVSKKSAPKRPMSAKKKKKRAKPPSDDSSATPDNEPSPPTSKAPQEDDEPTSTFNSDEDILALPDD